MQEQFELLIAMLRESILEKEKPKELLDISTFTNLCLAMQDESDTPVTVSCVMSGTQFLDKFNRFGTGINGDDSFAVFVTIDAEGISDPYLASTTILQYLAANLRSNRASASTTELRFFDVDYTQCNLDSVDNDYTDFDTDWDYCSKTFEAWALPVITEAHFLEAREEYPDDIIPLSVGDKLKKDQMYVQLRDGDIVGDIGTDDGPVYNITDQALKKLNWPTTQYDVGQVIPECSPRGDVSSSSSDEEEEVYSFYEEKFVRLASKRHNLKITVKPENNYKDKYSTACRAFEKDHRDLVGKDIVFSELYDIVHKNRSQIATLSIVWGMLSDTDRDIVIDNLLNGI